MNALLLLRSQLGTAFALGVVLLSAIALAALRLSFPAEVPGLELLLFGWLGVALGRLTIGGRLSDSGAAKGSPGAAEKVDHILRSVARLLQMHLTETDAFSERLRGASDRLAEHETSEPVNEIVMALIDDNRQMRDKLSNLRDQLEESRLRVLQLQYNLERSEEEGMRDVVTAVGNRRFFETAFAEELEKARTSGQDFCLALADLDRFKLVNDRFGHLVGDGLLRLFAEILVQNVRGQDRVARFGGEEFAVMLPGAGLSEAVEAAERIRRVLESKQWTVEPSGERVGKITVSFGVAKLRADETGADLLRRVDGHLYDAKARGRNRVVAERPEDVPPVSRRTRSRRAASV
ncbi:MAG: GGDEF domain-containing protein [Hyphomicrobiales bacterium]|nr:GGDEF domain-containing protein [Hyphomicrobiales bacterium]MBV8441380.1 GGDEF domain-containing protein [Hyphomicrobiales bacterium]